MATKKDDGVAFGIFRLGDRQHIAQSVGEAVRLRFDGWQEVKPAAAENQPPDAEQPTEQPGQ